MAKKKTVETREQRLKRLKGERDRWLILSCSASLVCALALVAGIVTRLIMQFLLAAIFAFTVVENIRQYRQKKAEYMAALRQEDEREAHTEGTNQPRSSN